MALIVALPREKLIERYLIAATDLIARDPAYVDGVYDGSLAAGRPPSDVFGWQFDHPAGAPEAPAPDLPIQQQSLHDIL
jgi:hypothetical protein